MNRPTPTEWNAEAWWGEHDRGTFDRPRPGTRVTITENSRYRGLTGTVVRYEGQWDSTTFPVLVDTTGVTMLCTPRDITELAATRVGDTHA